MNRLLCLISFSFSISSLACLLFGSSFAFVALGIVGALLFLSFLAYIIKRGDLSAKATIILAASFIAILSAVFIHIPKYDNARQLDGQYVTAKAEVVGISENSKYITLYANSNDLGCKLSLIISNEEKTDVDIGSTIDFSGELHFTDSTYNKGKECFVNCFPKSCKISESTSGFNRFIAKIRNVIRDSVSDFENPGLLNALLLGDTSALDIQTKDNFKRIGTTHILSISGFHLALIVMRFYLFISAFPLPKFYSAIIAYLVSLFYMLLTGFPLSLVRSAIMMSTFFFSRVSRRENDKLTALFLAVLIVVFVSPWSLFDIGFLLSVFATLGIVTLADTAIESYKCKLEYKEHAGSKKCNKRLSRIKLSLLESVYTTLSATVVTMPFIIASFNEFSVFSLIGNLFTVSLAEYYMIFGLIAVLIKCFSFDIIAAPLVFVSDIFGKAFVEITKFLADISPKLISLDTVFINWGIAVISIAIIVALLLYKKSRALIALVLFMCLFIPLFNLTTSAIVYPFTIIDTYTQGSVNSTVIRHKGNRYILDQSQGTSGKINIKGNAVGCEEVFDEAVFVIDNKIPIERIISYTTLYDIKRITLFTSIDTDDDYIIKMFLEKGIEVNIRRGERYDVTNFISAYLVPDIGTAFVVKTDKETFSSYLSKNKDSYINEAVNVDILVYDGVNCNLPLNPSNRTNFILGT